MRLEYIFVYWPLSLLPKHFFIRFKRIRNNRKCAVVNHIPGIQRCRNTMRYQWHFLKYHEICKSTCGTWRSVPKSGDSLVNHETWQLCHSTLVKAVIDLHLLLINHKFGASIEYKSNCVPIRTDYTFVKHKMSFQNTEFSPVMHIISLS